jgi:hypothetical protein
MIRRLSIIVVAFVIASTAPALAQSDTVKVEGTQLHALSGLLQVPTALSDKELAAIDGQGIVLANDHATPGLPFANPGTANAAGKIPSDVFLVSPGVGPNLWFGKAAGK